MEISQCGTLQTMVICKLESVFCGRFVFCINTYSSGDQTKQFEDTYFLVKYFYLFRFELEVDFLLLVDGKCEDFIVT